jgi:hypothetical protein
MAASPIICFLRAADSTNTVLSGAKANIYAAGTTTPLSLFSDTGLSVGAANPIVADAFGQFAIRYFAPVSYKIATTTSADVAVPGLSWDGIDPGTPTTAGIIAVANGGTGSATAGGARTNLGAASDAALTSVASDVSTLQGYHTGTTALKVAQGTTAQRSGGPTAYDMRGNSTLTSPEMYLSGTWHKISLAPSIAGGFKNLVIQNNSGTPNSQIDIDADAVTVETTDGVAARLNSINLTIDCTTTGANGLDAGSLANNTWYFHWVIFNPTTGTTAGLTSVSATSPTMPSGYTFKARFGAHVTNGSAQFHRILQKGRRAGYVVSASITTILPVISSGVQGTYSATSPTLASVSVAGYVPTTASKIFCTAANAYTAASQSSYVVAPSTTYGGSNNGARGSNGMTYPAASIAESAGVSVNNQFEMLLEGASIAVASDAAGFAVSCIGWEDNI